VGKRIFRLTDWHAPYNPLAAATGVVLPVDPALIIPFDGPDPFETDYTGDFKGHLGQKPTTATGGTIFRPGRNSRKAAQLAEATTNLLRNPSAETNLEHFVFANDGLISPLRERRSESAIVGNFGIRWVIGSSPDPGTRVQQAIGAAPTGSLPYTGQLKVRGVGTAVGKQVRAEIIETGGAAGQQSTLSDPVALTGDVQDLTHTHAIIQPDRTNLTLRLRFHTGATEGDEIHTDAWQVEQKAYATPYCDGSLGQGHAWTGTAHASTSTRTVSDLRYDSFANGVTRLQNGGTVMAWFRVCSVDGAFRVIFRASNTANDRYVMLRVNEIGRLQGFWGQSPIGPAITLTPYQWHHAAWTFDGSTRRLYLDGAQIVSAAGGGVTGDMNASYGAGNWLGTQPLNGWLSDLVVDPDNVYSAELIAAIAATEGPVLTGVDLIDGAPGSIFHIKNWRQALAGYKGGGTWQSSPISSGRRLVDKPRDNIIDTVTFNLKEAKSQDGAAEQTRQLVRLMERASDYWTKSWILRPSYIVTKAENETNARHSLIHLGRIPELDDPFDIVFAQNHMLDIDMILEHGDWTANPPGVGTPTPISAVEAYGGRNLGNVDSAGARQTTIRAGNVFVANKRTMANITHIYRREDVTGKWFGNLMGSSFTVILMTTSTFSESYFGVNTALANTGPFSSLVFDLDSIRIGGAITWEYWNGTTWASLSVVDNTAGLSVPGVNSVTWFVPTNWASVNLLTHFGGDAPNVAAYWVRARVTTVGTASPTQQNRNVYSAIWPYVEIGRGDVTGDLEALIKMAIKGQRSGSENANRIVIGARHLDRGAGFTAYLNASDVQNPAGMSLSALSGTFQNSLVSHTGRVFRYAPAGVAAIETRLTFNLYAGSDYSFSENYHGKFQVFARTNGGVAGLVMRVATDTVTVGAFQYIQLGETYNVATGVNTVPQITDLGSIDIPGFSGPDPGEQINSFRIHLQIGKTTAGAANVDVIDLILIPADEIILEAHTPDTEVFGSGTLLIDSVSKPKIINKTVLYHDDVSGRAWRVRYSGAVSLIPNVHQRLWFLFMLRDSNGRNVAFQSDLRSITLEKQERYISMRGNE
jgi:hypothetical protein